MSKKNGGNQQSNNQNEGNKPKFTGKCQTCGKVDHKAAKCWNDERNKEKRPNWWKVNGEAGAAAIATESSSNDSCKFLLMAMNRMEFKASAKNWKTPMCSLETLGRPATPPFLTSASKISEVQARRMKLPMHWVKALEGKA